jgi:glutaredoxin-like protein NrdH
MKIMLFDMICLVGYDFIVLLAVRDLVLSIFSIYPPVPTASLARENQLRKEQEMPLTHVPGKNAGHLVLYALSTCPWCKKTKKLLDDLGVQYDFTDVDLLTGDEKNEVVAIVKKWNPHSSFPILVINDKLCIVGFEEDQIRKALKL